MYHTGNNISPATASQDTIGYSRGSDVFLVYGVGQIAGNLAADAAPSSTGAHGSVTQAVYGAPVELIKGTFTGAAPSFTGTSGDTGSVFVTSSGYGVLASVLAFNTVTVLNDSVSQPAVAEAVSTPPNGIMDTQVQRWPTDGNESDVLATAG